MAFIGHQQNARSAQLRGRRALLPTQRFQVLALLARQMHP
jgi:hypothetical protein